MAELDHTHDHSHDHSNGHGHSDGHDHSKSHGHQHDQGLKGFLRYLRFLPQMWRSDVNNAVVARLAPSSGDVVVDIGAGMGSGVAPAALTGAQVVAVEPTNYMRAMMSARRLGQRARKQISIQKGTAEHLNLAPSSATAVMAVNAMHHWDNIDVAAAQIEQVLKSGGRVLLVDEQFRDPSHPEYDRFDEEHDHEFEEADLDRTVAALTAAGLTNVEGAFETLANVPVLAFSATKP